MKMAYKILTCLVAFVLVGQTSLQSAEEVSKAFVFRQTGAASNVSVSAETLLINGEIPGNGTIQQVTIDDPSYFFLYKGAPVGSTSDSTGINLVKSGGETNQIATPCFVSTIDFGVLGQAKDVENDKRYNTGQSYTIRYNYLKGDVDPIVTNPSNVYPNMKIYYKGYKVATWDEGLGNPDAYLAGSLVNSLMFGPFAPADPPSYKTLPAHTTVALDPVSDTGKIGSELWMMKSLTSGGADAATISYFQILIYPVSSAEAQTTTGTAFPTTFKGD
jgi:hypothetical protein